MLKQPVLNSEKTCYSFYSILSILTYQLMFIFRLVLRIIPSHDGPFHHFPRTKPDRSERTRLARPDQNLLTRGPEVRLETEASPKQQKAVEIFR